MLMVPSKSKWRWGFIARGHNGQVFGSGAGKIEHCSDVFQTLKLRQHYRVFFLQWELEHTIELETDAINIKTALSSSAYDLATGGVLFPDIKFLLHSEFC
jgi:hypothetical protein